MKTYLLYFFFITCAAFLIQEKCNKKLIIKHCLQTKASTFGICVRETTQQLCASPMVPPTSPPTLSPTSPSSETPTSLETTTHISSSFETTTMILSSPATTTTASTTTFTTSTIPTTTTAIQTSTSTTTSATTSTTTSTTTTTTTLASTETPTTETSTFQTSQTTETSTTPSDSLTSSYEDFAKILDSVPSLENPLTVDGLIPTDGDCKKIDLDFTLISKVCVKRRSLQFCLKTYPHEYEVCLKSVQMGLCYKKCFVNITPCFYQVPLKLPSNGSPILTYTQNLAPQTTPNFLVLTCLCIWLNM